MKSRAGVDARHTLADTMTGLSFWLSTSSSAKSSIPSGCGARISRTRTIASPRASPSLMPTRNSAATAPSAMTVQTMKPKKLLMGCLG